MFNSVRVRLTLWYVLALALLLAGFSVFVYVEFSKNLYVRLDRSLSNAAETMANFFQIEVQENGGDIDAGAVEALDELRLPNVYTAIFKGNRLLTSNYPESHSAMPPESLPSSKAAGGRAAFLTVDSFGEGGARVVVLPVEIGQIKCSVMVAESLHDLQEQLASLRRTFYLGFPIALFAAGLGGFLLARKSLTPVVVMSDQAERISARNLHERLKVSNPDDELGRLAGVFNQLLSRLDRSFGNMRQFMADASHELRTPLAIIRGEADVALSQDREAAEYREALTIVQDEARLLSRIVDDMLALARADAGQYPLRIEEFYLNDLVEECYRAVQVLALHKAVSVRLEPAVDITFRGDEDLLRRLILNLLDNAIKYTPAGGSVVVKTVGEAARVRIVVSDTGIGIPAEVAPQVFERFYRVDKARSRADGGSGLGLSIAKWVAEAHHGSIDLVSQPERGSTFTVSLPR